MSKKNDYVFKSELTLETMPFGVTNLNEVDKSNVSNIMKEILSLANKKTGYLIALKGLLKK